MVQFKDCTVAILAGGKSRRFGTEKAMASIGKHSLMEIAIDLARKLAVHIFVIGDMKADRLPGHIALHSDKMPGNGPLGGIHTALDHAITPYVFLLPCDMPLMIPDVYFELASYRGENRPVVAVSHTGLEPLVSLWPKNALPIIERRLLAGRTSPIEALDELHALKVRMPEALDSYRPDIFHNINTRRHLKLISKRQ